ncbi:hypothetical protein DUNSADRAFT_11787 [Dunaliella salina]|uniref:Encoded protein n=1 Tax=Dunaliella salina TaxID=3046 RepID=A0ABQ7GCP4_DUNSA|nr:hypothetical protein DUNSADRAFT_11787 [Dunaliella salina]|eukprot:KAF5832345.1 hypothetical protein DUNSADRAFT_11787 [Dunaliella salina]
MGQLSISCRSCLGWCLHRSKQEQGQLSNSNRGVGQLGNSSRSRQGWCLHSSRAHEAAQQQQHGHEAAQQQQQVLSWAAPTLKQARA